MEPKRIQALILDVDGTIFDVRKRYVASFEKVIGNKVDEEKIISLRREGVSGLQILSNLTGNKTSDLKNLDKERHKWMNDNTFLYLDELLPSSKPLIIQLRKKGVRIFALTMRDPEGVKSEFKKHGLYDLFEGIYVKGFNSVFSGTKEEGIKEIISSWSFDKKHTCIVGDTEIEIKAGKSCGILTVGVLSGLSSRQLLSRYEPDAIIEDLFGLLNLGWEFG